MEGSGSDDAGRSVGEEGSSSSVEHGSGGVDNGSVSNHRPVSHDVSGSVGNGRAGTVGRHAGVGHLSNVAAVTVGVVGHGLGPAVGKGNAVGAGGGVTVTVLLLVELGSGVVISHAVGVGVGGGLVGVDGGGTVGRGGGVLGHGGGGEEGEDKGDLHVAGLKDCDQLMSDLSLLALFILNPASEAPAPKGDLSRIGRCQQAFKTILGFFISESMTNLPIFMD